jgi:hypothetical protein
MRNDIYNNFKEIIKKNAINEKKNNKHDKPMIRENLNNLLDSLIRQLNYLTMIEKITLKQSNLYINWLTSYVCKLQP